MQPASLLQKGIVELAVKQFSLYALLTICWLLIACAGLAFAVFLDIHRESQRFSETSALVQTQLASQIRRYVDAVHGLAAFLKVQGPLNQEKLTHYTRLLADQDASIYFMGVASKFGNKEMDEFVTPWPDEDMPTILSGRIFSLGKNHLMRVTAADKRLQSAPDPFEPDEGKVQSLSAIGSDFMSVLENALQQALESRAIAISRPFLLDNGERGYALVEPVNLGNGVIFAVVICRVSALLHPSSETVSLALTLFESSHANTLQNDKLIHRQALPVSSLESALFPRLFFRTSLDEPAKHFLLEIERQLGWADLDWRRLNLIFVGSFAFLIVFLIIARIHDRYEKRKLEEGNRLFLLANFDPLTGLPNRQLFMNRLDQALTAADRSNQKVALLYLDLDGFKQINDYYGHQTGDKVLQRAARIFQHSIRETDTVGRLGGDEFVVLLQSVADRCAAEYVARKIKKAFFKPSVETSGNHEVMPVVGTSVGIAVYPEDGLTAAELLRAADQSMYRDKAVGKSQPSSTVELKSLGCHPASW